MLWFKIVLTVYFGLQSILMLFDRFMEEKTSRLGMALNIFFLIGIWVYL